MSVRTRAAEAPGRIARRVQAAERVKSGAAQRAYSRRKLRAEQLGLLPAASSVRTAAFTARIPFVAAIIALLGCGLALTLLLTTRAAEDSYQLSDARNVNQRLLDERAALQREVAAADSAPELAERARELGMIPAVDPARLLIAPDGTITVVGEPAPAQGTPAPPLNGPAGRGERPVPVTALPAPAPAPPGVAPSPVPGAPVPAPAPPGAAAPGAPGAAAEPAAPVAPGTGGAATRPAAPVAPDAGAPAAPPEPPVETLGVPIEGTTAPAPEATPPTFTEGVPSSGLAPGGEPAPPVPGAGIAGPGRGTPQAPGAEER